MPDFHWPADLVPFQQRFFLQPHTLRQESPFTRRQKVIALSAARWVTTIALRGGYDGTTGIDEWGPRLDAFIAQLEGGAKTVGIADYRRPSRRLSGFPVSNWSEPVAGDTEMEVYGFPTGTAGELAFKAGDYFRTNRPHVILEDSYTDSLGKTTIKFKPPLTAPLTQGQLSFGEAWATFRLTSDDAGDNSTEVGQAVVYQLEFAEDMPDPLDGGGVEIVAGETDYFLLNGRKSLSSTAVIVRDSVTPANDVSQSVKDWLPTLTWPSKSVLRQDLTGYSTTAGDVPEDWSRGGPRIKTDNADIFRIPKSQIPDCRTLIFQGEYTVTPSAGSGESIISVYDTGSAEYVAAVNASDANLPEAEITFTFSDGTTKSQALGQVRDLAGNGESLCIGFSWGDDGLRVSINGEPCSFDARMTTAPDWDTIQIRGTNVVYFIDYIAGLKRTMDDNELAATTGKAGYHPFVISSLTMGADSSTATTGTERMPSGVLLSDNGSIATILGFHHQRDLDGSHDEAPLRIMEQKISFDGAKLWSTQARSVVSYESPLHDYDAGFGWAAAPLTVKRSYGPNVGRILQVFEQMVNVSGEIDGTLDQDLMFRYRASDDAPWSDPAVTILDASAKVWTGVGAATGDPVSTGASGRGVEFPADSAYPNRVIFSGYCFPHGAFFYWTEDDGANWTFSNMLTGMTDDPSEVDIALRNDGVLVATIRTEVDDKRYYTTSSNGGATWAAVATLPDFEGDPVASSMVQIDRADIFETPIGRLAQTIAGKTTTGFPRKGMQLLVYEATSMAEREKHWILSRGREWGYNGGLIVVLDGNYALLPVGSSINGFNAASSSHVVALRMPARSW